MVVVVGVANGRHSIEVDTVYIINKKGPLTTVNAVNQADPDHTSKTSSEQTLLGAASDGEGHGVDRNSFNTSSTAPNFTIAQNHSGVNEKQLDLRALPAETETQLQELALEMGRQALALEQLSAGDSIAGQLASEQLGRLALAMQEEQDGTAQNSLPTEKTPMQNADQELQRLQLAWENEAGELTEGGNDGKVNLNKEIETSSADALSLALEGGYANAGTIAANVSVFKNRSESEIESYLKSVGYDTHLQEANHSKSGAKIIRIQNTSGNMNISQVQISPGGGRHGINPYIKISTTTQGIIKIVFGDPNTYKTDGKETAILIFTGGMEHD